MIPLPPKPEMNPEMRRGQEAQAGGASGWILVYVARSRGQSPVGTQQEMHLGVGVGSPRRAHPPKAPFQDSSPFLGQPQARGKPQNRHPSRCLAHGLGREMDR